MAAGGWRSDGKPVTVGVGTGVVSAERRWRETSWDVSAHDACRDRLGAYATVQSGYQSGQFFARPYWPFADPELATVDLRQRDQENLAEMPVVGGFEFGSRSSTRSAIRVACGDVG